MKRKILGLAASSLLFMSMGSAQADTCTLNYTMTGWSAFYATASGEGVVNCPNGQSANVNLSLKGGGFTFGTSEIKQGVAQIRNITNIDTIYGGSFAMGGSAGFIKYVDGYWAPKGANTITLAGKGTGYSLGFSLGSLRITKR